MDLNQKLDMVRFLVDKGFVEAGLFYTRCSVFLAVQVIFAGYALKERPPSGVADKRGHATLRLVSVVGFAICLVWFFVNLRSISYNRAWLADARSLICSDPVLEELFRTSVLKTPGLDKPCSVQSANHLPILIVCFWNWPASWWMQALVIFLGLFWVLLPMLSIMGSSKIQDDYDAA